MKKLIRQGELLLVPVKDINGEWKKETDYIVSHSETGHHHVILGMVEIINLHKNKFIKVKEKTKLKHLKDFDYHKKLTIPAGTYEVIQKTEYDPFTEIIKQVQD